MWERANLKELEHVLSDVSDPVFIVTEDQKVSLANEAARRGCRAADPSGWRLHGLVYLAEEVNDFSLAWFSNEWLEVASRPFRWRGTDYTKVVLKKRKRVPSQDTLLTVQNMIAVLLNRLRSPLTGLQGYTELIQDDLNLTSLCVTSKGKLTPTAPADDKPIDNISSEPNDYAKRPEFISKSEERILEQKQAWYSQVYDGVQQLFDILDDLEMFHHGLCRTNGSTAAVHSWPHEIVKKVLLNHTPEERKRVSYTSSTPRTPLNCHPSVFENIISILIENALENSSKSEIVISLESPTPNGIKVTNRGPVIPDEILDYLYFPFVTSRSDKLGLGLTMAQLIATHQGALLYLSENSPEKGITFTLCLPPTRGR